MIEHTHILGMEARTCIRLGKKPESSVPKGSVSSDRLQFARQHRQFVDRVGGERGGYKQQNRIDSISN